MQTIYLKKFGNVLVSRPLGQEAFNAIRPQLNPEVPVQIDFDQVLTITPSWLDEFLTNLADFNKGKVELLPTKNPSVMAALPVLATARKDLVADIVNRALEQMQK
ncbi:hypothetical protein A2643_03280 [Candidatus Nomurabacteria bacterium RIFCSPHIGHO2_01_FULL_39_220]|nr:MAG: hypothetical protein A2643_03280 [Candidatus Nomurabacteria bacterium RIFCSPHIGHO2_01_FULL_39_220]